MRIWILLALFVSLVSIPVLGDPPGHIRGRWVELPALPTPRHDLQLIPVAGRIYAIAGAGDLTTDVVEVFDPKKNQWAWPAARIPAKRGWFGAAFLGGKIYCVGGKRVRTAQEKKRSGKDDHYQYLASLNIYNPRKNRWTTGKPLRDSDAGLKAAALGGRLYVLGGNHHRDRVEVYNPKRKRWSPGPALPEGRMAPGLEAVGGKLYVFGGYGAGGEKAEVFIFNPAKGQWTKGAPMPTPRRDLATAVLDGRIWCMGGVNGKDGYLSKVEVYDPKTNHWTTAGSLPKGKAWSGACMVDGRIYLGGGARAGKGGKGYDWLDDMHVFLPDPAAGAPADEIAVTWWGCMSFEVSIGELSLVFDPYVKPNTPRFDYIFCSHDHYDHGHEATLRKLVAGPGAKRLKMLFAARCCFYASRLQGPNNFSDNPLTDLGYVPRDKAMALYPKYRDRVGPHVRPEAKQAFYHGPTEATLGRLRVEGIRSHEDTQAFPKELKRDPALAGPWPNMAYLITDTKTGFSIAHLGDIWNAYPEMKRLRGKVDVLVYPLGKLPLKEKLKMMDYIRPKIAIPTHYRLFEDDFPIPANWDRKLSTGQLYRDPKLLKKACQGHWYPSPDDPPAEIKLQREKLKEFTRVVELKAGRRYVLPKDLATFSGRTR